MPNIAAALREEISRLARKELRTNTESLKKTVATYRSEIAALKRRVEALERQANRARKASAALGNETEHEKQTLRFHADGLKKHRERLGLSAASAGKIMGVSALSVYKWESGKVRPRAKQLEAIAKLRTLGKRDAQKLLEGSTE